MKNFFTKKNLIIHMLFTLSTLSNGMKESASPTEIKAEKTGYYSKRNRIILPRTDNKKLPSSDVVATSKTTKDSITTSEIGTPFPFERVKTLEPAIFQCHMFGLACDGSIVLCINSQDDKNYVKIYDILKEEVADTVNLKEVAYILSMSPNKNLLSYDSNGQTILNILNRATRTEVALSGFTKPYTDSVCTDITAAACADDNTLRLWDIESQKNTLTITADMRDKRDYFDEVFFREKESLLGGFISTPDSQEKCSFWDTRTKEKTCSVPGFSFHTAQVDLSSNGILLAMNGSVKTGPGTYEAIVSVSDLRKPNTPVSSTNLGDNIDAFFVHMDPDNIHYIFNATDGDYSDSPQTLVIASTTSKDTTSIKLPSSPGCLSPFITANRQNLIILGLDGAKRSAIVEIWKQRTPKTSTYLVS